MIDSSEADSPQTSTRLGQISLRKYLTDPMIMSAMRRFLAGTSEAPWLKNDWAIMDEIERRLDAGEPRLTETTRRPTPFHMQPATESSPPPKPVKTPAPVPAAPTPVAPEVTSLAKQQCSNPSCQGAFENAAGNGTPLIEADAPGC